MNIDARILQALRPRRDGVLLRSDVAMFGSPSRVSEALNSLIQKGLVIRIKRGVYAKPDALTTWGLPEMLSKAQARAQPARAARLTPTARRVQQLARHAGIRFTPTFTDRWAAAVTRLAGDEVRSDLTDDLLVALRRAGQLSPREMAEMVMKHHREQRVV